MAGDKRAAESGQACWPGEGTWHPAASPVRPRQATGDLQNRLCHGIGCRLGRQDQLPRGSIFVPAPRCSNARRHQEADRPRPQANPGDQGWRLNGVCLVRPLASSALHGTRGAQRDLRPATTSGSEIVPPTSAPVSPAIATYQAEMRAGLTPPSALRVDRRDGDRIAG